MAFSKLELYAPDGGYLTPVKPVQHGNSKIWSVYRGRELVWRVCKVKFVDWDGTQLKYEEVVLGHSATPPEDRERPGYVFDGWWPQYANIQANTTISAQYHQACHLELHAVPPFGGTVEGAGYYDQGERVEVRASPASGYSFSNWSDGESQTHSVVMDRSKSLSAYFVESQIVTVRFIDWDGRLLKSQAVVYGSDAAPPPSPSRAGYAFDRWEGLWTHVTENRDVIAAYTANQYTVTFNPAGGKVSPTSKLVTFDTEYGELPTPEDHPHDPQQVFSFAGWFTEPDGEGALVEENTLVSTPSDHTLHAAWDETTYFIVRFIDWNGDLLKEAFCGYGEDIPDEEVPPDPTREGYTFDHWEGSWTHVTENRDVIATYIENQRTIVFETDGGSQCEPMTVIPGEPIGELPETYIPKPEGYAGVEFDGWWTEATGGEPVTPETTVPEGTGPFTVYAHWLGVLHYENIGGVAIDADGVASGFYGSNSSPNANKYLRIVTDDKFDFSGNFDIVFKCSDIPTSGPSRRDVFSGISEDESSENQLMDFGMAYMGGLGADLNGHYGCWEIADPDNYGDMSKLIGNKLSGTVDLPGPIWLSATRRGDTIKCYVQTGDYDWRLDKDGTGKRIGNFTPSVFTIGMDQDAPTEYFPSKIHLNECYLQLYNTNTQQHIGKYVLRPAMMSSSQPS